MRYDVSRMSPYYRIVATDPLGCDVMGLGFTIHASIAVLNSTLQVALQKVESKVEEIYSTFF